jgi:Clp amino terminal domain, pathogenicity island component
MFERFTDRARRVVDLAEEEARRLNHNYIGTEQLLLGLIRSGEAAKMLEPAGIGLARVEQLAMQRALQRGRVGRGEDAVSVEEIIAQNLLLPPVSVPFTDWAKEALELAIREAAVLGVDYIGAEHILLGLIRAHDGVAAQLLMEQGADLNRVRLQVLQQLLGAGLARIDSLDRRLAAIEGWVGIPVDLRDSDQKVAQMRSEKKAAISSFEFDVADALREEEKQLLAARAAWQKDWTEPAAGRLSLAEELGRVNAELERLRAILHEHGIEPGGDPA